MASSDPNHKVIDPIDPIISVNLEENDVIIKFDTPKIDLQEKIHLRAFGIGATKF